MFKFAAPWALLFLFLPILVRLLRRAQVSDGAALKIPFYQKVIALNATQQRSISRHHYLPYLTYLAWLLLVIAAAGPQWLGPPIELPQSGRDLMLAMDLSGSMQIPDMQLNGHKVDRLRFVKSVAKQFVEERKGDRLGLILFGTRAYLQTPLTFDRKTIQHMLDDATIGLAGPQTAIGDAIGLAIKRLKDTPQKSRVLILLTDGASNAGVLKPVHAAEMAAEHHIKIYTIGIGATRLLVPGLFGPQLINPSNDLDESTLKQIATVTGGLFFRAQNTQDLRKVYRTIEQLEPISQDKTVFRPITAYYQWPLGIALLISLFLAWHRTRPWFWPLSQGAK